MNQRFGSTLKTEFSTIEKHASGNLLKKELLFNIDDLVEGRNDWKNIPEAVRACFKGLIENLVIQQNELKELKEEVSSETLIMEFKEELEKKANLEDVRQTLDHVVESVDQKVSKEDISELLKNYVLGESIENILQKKVNILEVGKLIDSKLSLDEYQEEVTEVFKRIEELRRDLKHLESKSLSRRDLEQIHIKLAEFSDYSLMKEELQSKLDKELAFQIFDKKVDVEYIDSALEEKADHTDLEKLYLEVERKADSGLVEKISKLLLGKVDSSDINELCDAINKKASQEKVDEMLINFSSLKEELERFFAEISDKFSDLSDFSDQVKDELGEVNRSLLGKALLLDLERVKTTQSQKLDADTFATEWTVLNKKLGVEMEQLKVTYLNFRKDLEEGQLMANEQQKNKEDDMLRTIKELKEELSLAGKERENEVGEMMEFVKCTRDNIKNEFVMEIETLIDRINQIELAISAFRDTKADKRELESKLASLKRSLSIKVDIEEVQASLNAAQADMTGKLIDLRDEVLSSIKLQTKEFAEDLERKANSEEIHSLLNQKVDNFEIQSLIDNYLKSLDLEILASRLGEIEGELMKSTTGGEFETKLRVMGEDLQHLKKAVLLKANLEDICSLLDQKPDINDINRAMESLQKEIVAKTDKNELHRFVNEQSVINEFLCTENIIGRWKWKSGVLQNGNQIPWELQTINTLSDNFMWEKNSPYITVTAPGLYLISFGLFSSKKPTAQLLINNQLVYSALNSSAYKVHHSSGKMQALQNPLGKGIRTPPHTGLTLTDFFRLPPKAQICLVYGSNSRGQGFLSIKRVQ